MDTFEFTPDFALELPLPEILVLPIPDDALFSFSPIPVSTNIDICQQRVKNQDDFSQQIMTSGGLMYQKSRVLV